MAKKILLGAEGLRKILIGINSVADAVKSTLGPEGRTVVLGKYTSPEITKDGVKVARNITLSDAEENLGCQLAKDVASATVDAAGDGTTTATVLFQNMFMNALKFYETGVSPVELREGMKFGVREIVEYLRKNAQQISFDKKKIQEVATISANGDANVGKLIAEMIHEVGQDGIITVEDGKSTETTSEKVEGMKFDQGFKSNYFVNNQQKQLCEMENPYILILDKKLDSAQQAQQIAEIFEKYVRTEPLLVIAEDILDPVLPLFVINSVRQYIKVCAVKAPGFGDSRSAMAEDIAIFTGATYISEATGHSLDNFQPAYLGRAKKVIVDSKSTTIISGNGDKNLIDARCEALKLQIARETSEYTKNNLESRIAKLKGKAGILHVGGTTEAEQKELKDRVEDAVQAVKAAITSGILPGGGSSYMRAQKMLGDRIEEIRKNNGDPKIGHKSPFDLQQFIWGISVIQYSLDEPLKQSLINAGLEDQWQIITDKIRENNGNTFGYDVAKKDFCDMIACGIVDAAECSIAALQNAGHTAALLIASGAIVTDKPEPKENNTGGPGMGGMGY